MVRILSVCCLCLMITFLTLTNSQAEEVKSRYAKITFQDESLLREFNDNLTMSRQLYQYAKKRTDYTIIDEVKNKIDVVVEKVEVVLDMFPASISFNVLLLPDEEDVQKIHHQVYNRKAEYIAFFSPKTNTVYVSVDDIDLRVLAHEIGHMVVESYFKITPPTKMHELLAQFAAAHITD